MFKYYLRLTLLIVSLSFGLLLFSNHASAAIENKPGDIIITKSTAPGLSGKGLAGHSGIYVGKKTILHTSGRAKEPWPTKISESDWHGRYAHSKVVRPKSASLGEKASKKALKYFYGKKIPYAITPNFKNIEKTYCSELVWYSYYKAGKTFVPINTTALLIAPYDFINSWAVSYNDFKFIDNKW